MAAPQSSAKAARPARASWARLADPQRAALALVPVWLVWTLLTPVYNRFLLGSARNLLHLTESPNVTDLLRRDDHFAYIPRRDFPPSKSLVHSFRVTDCTSTCVMLGVALPGGARASPGGGAWRTSAGRA